MLTIEFVLKKTHITLIRRYNQCNMYQTFYIGNIYIGFLTDVIGLYNRCNMLLVVVHGQTKALR